MVTFNFLKTLEEGCCRLLPFKLYVWAKWKMYLKTLQVHKNNCWSCWKSNELLASCLSWQRPVCCSEIPKRVVSSVQFFPVGLKITSPYIMEMRRGGVLWSCKRELFRIDNAGRNFSSAKAQCCQFKQEVRCTLDFWQDNGYFSVLFKEIFKSSSKA